MAEAGAAAMGLIGILIVVICVVLVIAWIVFPLAALSRLKKIHQQLIWQQEDIRDWYSEWSARTPMPPYQE